jgi:hypothetical protein
MAKRKPEKQSRSIARNAPRVPGPRDDVRMVWGPEQTEHMDTRIDEKTGEPRGIDESVFDEAWRDPDRTDLEIQDLGPIVRVRSDASVRERGEITIVWFFEKADAMVVIPRTGFWRRETPHEGGGMLLGKGRELRRSRKEKSRKKEKRGEREKRRRAEEYDEDV